MSNYASQYRVARVLAKDPALRERDQRLEALKAVVGKVGHDFNNFLAPLLGYVSLIKEEVPQDSSAMQYATILESAAQKSESHLDSILLAMRPNRHFNPKEVDFAQFVRAQVAEWRELLPDTAQILVEECLPPARIVLDEAHWRRAINALLSNAHYALATGGKLQVRLQVENLTSAEQEQIGIDAASVHKLVIQDNGFGMSEEVAARAFEPFFTTRGGIKAAGLGLTIVHSVTQLQGGQVRMETKEDHGTTVTLWIPPKPAGIQLTRVAKNFGAGIADRSKILLVDDDPIMREVLKGALGKMGKEIFVASDGEEGFKTFSRFKDDWALVISDILMPGTGGIEFFHRVKEKAPEVRFLFLTGNAALSNEQLIAEVGMEAPMVMRKPFTLKSFNDVTRRLLS